MPKPITKRCSTCLQYKELVEFGRCRSREDGFQSQCRKCRRELAAQYYQAHRTEILEKIKRRKQQQGAKP
jgi:hypothetical protein